MKDRRVFRAKTRHLIPLLCLLSASPEIASAQSVIAHRGVFHDVNDANQLPENTAQSVERAANLGLAGVELDLRLASDGDVMVTHDVISNRTTTDDNDAGMLNPVQVTLGNQRAVPAIAVSSADSVFWSSAILKAYGVNARLLTNGAGGTMTDLSSMLTTLKDRGVFAATGRFVVILDIQDPNIFAKAATIVTREGLEGSVYLKFFAKKALFSNYTYSGPATCAQYMKDHALADARLEIIPQINDGELDIDENDNAGVSVWGTTLSIPAYLSCWATARTQNPGLAYMPIVSASVPEDNTGATNGAQQAFAWAGANQRNTMSIVPNPDAGVTSGSGCLVYSFSSNSVAAFGFNLGARTSKAALAANNAVTYIIYDVMGDLNRGSTTVDYTAYVQGLCGS